MAKRIIGSTPKADGYRMPAEFEPQDGVWMLWPERNDNWRSGAKPAQETFCQVARAIARFEKVTMCVSAGQYCGPTFLVNGQGGLRAVDWTFNAWGGLYDGLYFPWDRDDQVAQKICEMADVDSYRTLSQATDAKGRRLKVHKLCLTREPCRLEGAETIDAVEGTVPRENGEVSIASYMNFLIVNGGVILPQYGDENDALAVRQVQEMFPDREVVGVQTREVAFGGGNIHCITQQQPRP